MRALRTNEYGSVYISKFGGAVRAIRQVVAHQLSSTINLPAEYRTGLAQIICCRQFGYTRVITELKVSGCNLSRHSRFGTQQFTRPCFVACIVASGPLRPQYLSAAPFAGHDRKLLNRLAFPQYELHRNLPDLQRAGNHQ